MNCATVLSCYQHTVVMFSSVALLWPNILLHLLRHTTQNLHYNKSATVGTCCPLSLPVRVWIMLIKEVLKKLKRQGAAPPLFHTSSLGCVQFIISCYLYHFYVHSELS